MVFSKYLPVLTVTVAFPVPEEGVTPVSQVGLGFGSVTLHVPEQLILKVTPVASDGIEMLSGSRVMVPEVEVRVTLADLLFPLTVRVPPAAVAEAFTVIVPLLLPLVGVAVYPLGALTVHATFEVTEI